jgi:hypothetical protein
MKDRRCVIERKRIGVASRVKINSAYVEVIAELGTNAPYISKDRIYHLVSEKVNLSKSHVKNVLLSK